MATIEWRSVERRFRRALSAPVHAVVDATATIKDGDFALLTGPNGAGKTTLLALTMGHLFPHAGSVLINGQPPRTYRLSGAIGFVGDRPFLPPRASAGEAFKLCLQGASTHEIEQLMQQFALLEFSGRAVSALSFGTAKRLSWAVALARPRQLILLDEALDGLSDEWREICMMRLQEQSRAGATVIAVSHRAGDYMECATRQLSMNAGRLVASELAHP